MNKENFDKFCKALESYMDCNFADAYNISFSDDDRENIKALLEEHFVIE
jgi:hypothetical protein